MSMSEAKRIVTEDATAEELPERFRRGIEPTTGITVVVTEKTSATNRGGGFDYHRFWGIAAHRNTSIDEAVARVRELRDEWDER